VKTTTYLSRYLADLQAWAATVKAGAKVILARDPYHALYLLATAPDGFLAVLVDDGDTEKGHREDPLREGAFSLYLQVSQPLDADPGRALLHARPGGLPALLDLCEAAEARVRSLMHPGDTDLDDSATYAGREGVTVSGEAGPVPLPAYRLRFTIQFCPDAAAPRPVPQPQG
jgi:hypothetical protein